MKYILDPARALGRERDIFILDFRRDISCQGLGNRSVGNESVAVALARLPTRATGVQTLD